MLITKYEIQNIGLTLDSTTEQLAQGIKATRDISVGVINLYLGITGIPGGYVYLEIQEDADGLPANIPIDNGVSLPILSSAITTAGEYSFVFETDVQPILLGNTPYHIVIKTANYTADATNYIQWYADQLTPHYQKGTASSYDGTTWTTITTTTSFYFSVYSSNRITNYPSLQQIESLTKSLTASASGKYDTTTIPSITEVLAFQDDVTAMLDGLLVGAGIAVPITEASVGIIRLYANNCVAMQCEMTQMSAGFRSDNSDTRAAAFKRMCDTLVNDLTSGGNITEAIKQIETGADVSGVGGLSAGTVFADERAENEANDNVVQSTFKVGMFRQ